MRPILALLGLTAAALLAVGVLTLAFRDTGLLVPPAEMAAEGLVRQLATRRSRQTPQYLSANARATLSPKRLAAWLRGLEAEIGSVEMIEGESARTFNDSGDARVVVTGRNGSRILSVPVVREHGLWLVAELPE